MVASSHEFESELTMTGRHCHRSLVSLPVAAAILLLSLFVTPAAAGQRVALVIGNASYAHSPSLANPLNDANDIGAALGRLGFKVAHIENGGRAELWDGLQKFSLAASASEMAVVFYAGHGIEVDKRNFLVPVDARLLSDADVEFEAVPLDLLSRAVEQAKGLRLVILDACRDNPFAVAMQRAGATRSIGRGLASVEPSGETLVAYAAKGGSVAADGVGRNSPYTTALLAHLEEPGLEIGLMFRKVRDAVLASTGGRQEPFVYGSLSSEGAYLAALPEPEPEPTPPPDTVTVQGGEEPKAPDPDQVLDRRISAEKELLFWESINDSEHAADFEAYLRQFPGGTYEALARNRLARLTTNSQDEEPSVQVAVTPEEPKQEVSPEPLAPTPDFIEAGLRLNREERRLIQQGLTVLAFDPGPSDGLFGQRTREAISRWQVSTRGMVATGYLDADAARTLLAAGEAALEPFGPDWIIAENQPCQLWDASGVSGDETVTWSGGCIDGKASGQGHAVWRTPGGVHVSEGGYLNGRQNGFGTYIWPDGDRYEGEWRDGKRHGYGTYIKADGARYEGEWRDGKTHGHGTFTWTDGGRYEGEWRDGKRHGYGTHIQADGARYEGQYLDSKKHGQGTLAWPNGDRYEGRWRDGKPHGYGSYNYGPFDFTGLWHEGCFDEGVGNRAALSASLEDCGFE